MKYNVLWLARKKSSLLLQIVVQTQCLLSGILKMARLDICNIVFTQKLLGFVECDICVIYLSLPRIAGFLNGFLFVKFLSIFLIAQLSLNTKFLFHFF